MSAEDEVTLEQEEEASDDIEEAVVADLVTEHRERRAEAKAKEPASTDDARFVEGVVEEVTPEPKPDTTRTIPELVEAGYEPKKLQLTLRTEADTTETVKYPWKTAKEILSWYGDGTIRGLVSESVIVDTDGRATVALPDDTNRHTSRFSHRARMLLAYHLGLSDKTRQKAAAVTLGLIGIPLLVLAAAMPVLYPTNPPVWAVIMTVLGGPLGFGLFVYGYAKGAKGAVSGFLHRLNQVDD